MCVVLSVGSPPSDVLFAGGDFVSIWLGGQQPQNQNGHPARNRRAMKLEWFEGFRDRSAAKEVYRRLLVCYRS